MQYGVVLSLTLLASGLVQACNRSVTTPQAVETQAVFDHVLLPLIHIHGR